MRNQTRLILMGIFLAVLTAAGVLFWVVTERLSDDAAAEQIDEILDGTEQTAISTITEAALDVDRVEQVLLRLAEDLDRAGTEPERAMLQALQFVPELSGVLLANSDGDFRFVFRDEGGFGIKRVQTNSDGDGDRQVRFTELDENQVELSSRLDPDDEFDPRTRPWYQAAVASPGESVWTDPYLFFTSQQPGITKARASSDPSAAWVVGVDVQLTSLVQLLDELSTQNSGEVFIYDGESGALSRNGLVDLSREPTPADERIRAALEAGGDGRTRTDEDRIEFEVGGEPHTARFTSIPLGDGGWSVVTDISDADVQAPVSGVVRALQLLALGISVVATVALAFLLVPATKPIRRLEEHATIDALTALPNRRAILRRGVAECAKGGALAVAMIDVDKFKRVNDEYGHFVGDEALRGLAQRLVDSGHEAGRLGGEEFVVLLRTDHADAGAAAEELRRSVAAEPVMTAAGPISFTISAGVAFFIEGDEFADVLRCADNALLTAKSQGRNRVVTLPLPTAVPAAY